MYIGTFSHVFLHIPIIQSVSFLSYHLWYSNTNNCINICFQKKAKKDSDDEVGDLGTGDVEMEFIPRRTNAGRARAPVKYNFDDSDDDFDDY